MKRTVAILFLLLVCNLLPVGAMVLHVRTTGNDSNSGLTWAAAKKTIMGAILVAHSGDEIWVRKGSYVEAITLKSGVSLYGGFSGSEISISQRNPAANSTVIDGNQSTYVVTVEPQAEPNTRLDGFSIKNGFGGVMCRSGSAATISNNTIMDNYAAYNPPWGGSGIFCDSACLVAQHNTISGNSASEEGGGIRCINSAVDISDNVITDNSAGGWVYLGYGGGISCSGGSARIAGNVIAANGAYDFGGGIHSLDAYVEIRNNVVTDNGAYHGGGIWTSGGVITVSDCIIETNGAFAGGGIACFGDSVSILSNRIEENNASQGGGLYCRNSSPMIFNNTIVSNNAYPPDLSRYPSGGGVYVDHGSPSLVNNTFAGNSGDAIYCEASSPTIINNIVAFNYKGITLKASTDVPSIDSNCVYGNRCGDYNGLPPGADDIAADPRLASLRFGNTHIEPTSPCRDAGYDAVVHPDWKDVDGEQRIQGLHVDIGADESDGNVWPTLSAVVRVSPNGNDANDGSDWTMPKLTIQAAIDSVSATGGEVWVAAGTYKEHLEVGSYTYVYGGFAGTEDSRLQRDWRRNTSAVSGDGSGDSIVRMSGKGYLLFCFDGFTIRDAKSYMQGGGIYCIGSPFVENNILVNNSSSWGAGGLLSYNGFPIIRNNSIVECSGGIDCSVSSPEIQNNIVAHNGFGISCWRSSPVIVNNTIVSNIGMGVDFTKKQYDFGPYAPVLANNIVALNSGGVRSDSVYDVDARSNCVFGNGSDYQGISPSKTDISIDPAFSDMNSQDYHIRRDSPCVNAGWNEAPGLPIYDIDGEGRICGGRIDLGADELWPMPVQIDILPGESPNKINLKNRGYTPVAVLTTQVFDATSVDPATTTLAGCPVARRAKDGKMLCEISDIDLDGDPDLLLRFPTNELPLAGANSATLRGKTLDGSTLEGSDSVVIVGR